MSEPLESSDHHQLWVNLSALGDGGVFAILPQLMQKMLDSDGNFHISCEDDANFQLVLPSDNRWQTKIYYKLVEKQRVGEDAAEEEPSSMFEWAEEAADGTVTKPKLHDWNIVPKPANTKSRRDSLGNSSSTTTDSRTRISGRGPVMWNVSDLAKAGRLLANPPLATEFDDEQEMRRVYTLIYDVFRHKNPLSQALQDSAFFLIYPELSASTSHIWLLFYDLYHRGFTKREPALAQLADFLFNEARLSAAETALWELRTKLAAAVARLRIEHNALSLTDLLPRHLRQERVGSNGQLVAKPFTCWINLGKLTNQNVDEFRKHMETVLNVNFVEDKEQLRSHTCKWDAQCPQIVKFHGSLRDILAKSDLVKHHCLVMQDRSFCLGPATFLKHITDLQLTGNVIQTHVNSPRTTAYLAAILLRNEKIKKLMAFSAGTRKSEYETYFHQLGMNNIAIFSDRLIDTPQDAQYMEEVVAVFATPPNSYTAVTDPIDLVCSRGGDLSMLEILTESEESAEGKERVAAILDEQRRTLRFAMSQPQIQFVLYETHSELEAENAGMVERIVREINRMAQLQHAKVLLPAFSAIPQGSQEIKTEEINNNEADENAGPQEKSSGSEAVLLNVQVPDTDLFAIPAVPSLTDGGNSRMNSAILSKEGCYLALLQRKQVIRLDNKYMIQMAENRGLFGKSSSSTSRMKGSKGARKKQAEKPVQAVKIRRRLKDEEVERIAAPTHTFLRKSKVNEDVGHCSRCHNDEDDERDNKNKPPIYRQWWSETTRHIMALRTTLMRNKIIPSTGAHSMRNKDLSTAKSVLEAMRVCNQAKIDEIVAKSRGTADLAHIPIFPRLKLTREPKPVEKVQMRLPVTRVELRTAALIDRYSNNNVIYQFLLK